MIIDGKAIAADVLRGTKERADALGRELHLSVLVCSPTFATEKFLAIKKQRAEEAGVHIDVVELPADSSTERVEGALKEHSRTADGIVIQLPFPEHIDIATVLAHLPADRDVDGIGTAAEDLLSAGEALVLPPVAGAIDEIVRRFTIEIAGKHIAVIGRGRLVGKPAAVWARQKGGEVTVFDKTTLQTPGALEEMDVIISGAGSPGAITPDMVKDGVAIFDAGTSEEGGKLVGDADPAVAEKAAVFTPVPGGIGPITVAKLFENLAILAARRK